MKAKKPTEIAEIVSSSTKHCYIVDLSHITGKAFIPFFFGGDTHRVEQFYAGEGILTFSPAHFAGEPNILVAITVDPTEQGVAH